MPRGATRESMRQLRAILPRSFWYAAWCVRDSYACARFCQCMRAWLRTALSRTHTYTRAHAQLSRYHFGMLLAIASMCACVSMYDYHIAVAYYAIGSVRLKGDGCLGTCVCVRDNAVPSHAGISMCVHQRRVCVQLCTRVHVCIRACVFVGVFV